MTKKLSDYLKEKDQDLELVQAKVPRKLKKEVKQILKSRHLTWNDLIVAAMRQLKDENER